MEAILCKLGYKMLDEVWKEMRRKGSVEELSKVEEIKGSRDL